MVWRNNASFGTVRADNVFAAGNLLGGLGVGNVYHVCKSTDTAVYKNMQQYFGGLTHKNDGTAVLHTDIQTALDATVECRNDYVIVQPSNSDYDLTAVLTMSKKCVHLICPAGLGYDIGATNAARLHQNTIATAVIAVSDASIEIAGFYFKNYTGVAAITMAATSYAPNIHHNTFAISAIAAWVGSIIGAGDAGGWGKIERNWFVSQGGGAQTCAAGIIQIQASATAAQVNHNQITVGDTQIATIGIANYAVKGNTNFNIFSESGGSGVADGGTITKCIAIHASGCAIGNIGAVATGQMLTGGTTLHSYAENYGAYIANTGTTNGSVEA
jgi:hypothetical protein